jgi:hypothetical protein
MSLLSSPGWPVQERRWAGDGIGQVKVTSIMAETDLERRVLKFHIICILLNEKKGKDDIELC